MSAAAAPSRLATILPALFVALQYLLPQHALSRVLFAATRVRTRWFKNLLTRGFLHLYRVDLAQAAETDPLQYSCFNAFFTRALQPDARPIAADPAAIASPADGTVSACGRIDGERLLQAKGHHYALGDLLAGQACATEFAGGSFMTIYLAPCDYHRVHMPFAGRLRETVYVPGRLFSVNASTVSRVPRLFARNERVMTVFDGAAGPFALILVGALNVGSIATVWAGDITPARRRRITRLQPADVALAKGAELGRFNMGSTVIMLFAAGRARWDDGLGSNSRVLLGQAVGRVA